MNEKINQRLAELRNEYQGGQQLLQELQQKQANLEQTLLRIAGAIQVLEEIQVVEEQPSESFAKGEIPVKES